MRGVRKARGSGGMGYIRCCRPPMDDGSAHIEYRVVTRASEWLVDVHDMLDGLDLIDADRHHAHQSSRRRVRALRPAARCFRERSG